MYRSEKPKTKVETVEQQQTSVMSDEDFIVDAVKSTTNIKGPQNVWITPLLVNNTIIPLKLDTGSDVNILSFNDFKTLKDQPKLLPTKVKLTEYEGSEIPTIGECILRVHANSHSYYLKFIISPQDVTPILGLKSCEKMGLIQRILKISLKPPQGPENVDTPTVKQPNGDPIFSDYADVFTGLGDLPGQVHIQLTPNAIPRIDAYRMEQIKVIEKVERPTQWVNSMVVVHKPNGALRICMDPKNLNKSIMREHYKLPTREEVMSRFAGATVFSKLDASGGFWQLNLDNESSDLCTFNTQFGRYRYLRLPFGISSAPEILYTTGQFTKCLNMLMELTHQWMT
ncbi:Hypothetical predicted protein [Paramuricea clavata]|uniref:Reverse transcriptase domain-containing protein n=1 Tax=Paramuricea clavata TaxID=317549 RepID=A0A7D9KV95_PARCT|nr:Hypothetical predicted protein [Paramuricea clavata]